MKIGVDFDDVLLDSYASLLAYHNHHYGTTNQPGDIRDWHIQHTWNCSSEEALRRVEEWYGTAWHEQIVPIPGARTAVEKLAKRHELHVITGRPAQVAEMTRRQACEHFPGVFKEVHLTSHFKANARSKGDVCRALGVELMIEDALPHARAVANAGVPVLLFDRPWNQEPVEGLITRIFSWDDVERLVPA